MISYVDDKIGGLMAALEAARLAEDTIIVLTSDHGDMLGERGLWYKMNFFEESARVPLIIHTPGRFAPRRVPQNVSLVDLMPTFLDLAGADGPLLDGRSLAPLMAGQDEGWGDTVLGEYTAEGAIAPIFMARRGPYKYIACAADPPQLYHLADDPHERVNLAGDAAHGEAEQALAALVAETWDGDALTRRVIASQDRRRMVFDALMTGRRSPWDYRTPRDDSKDYIRNTGALSGAERRARLPYREAPKPDGEDQ